MNASISKTKFHLSSQSRLPLELSMAGVTRGVLASAPSSRADDAADKAREKPVHPTRPDDEVQAHPDPSGVKVTASGNCPQVFVLGVSNHRSHGLLVRAPCQQDAQCMS